MGALEQQEKERREKSGKRDSSGEDAFHEATDDDEN